MARPRNRSPRAKAAAKAAVTAPGSPGALPPIDCVVVLMQENRAFDHLFGKWAGAAGIGTGGYSNRPHPSLPAGPGNLAISAGEAAQFSVAQGQGPGHSLDDTNVQLFTSRIVAPGAEP